MKGTPAGIYDVHAERRSFLFYNYCSIAWGRQPILGTGPRNLLVLIKITNNLLLDGKLRNNYAHIRPNYKTIVVSESLRISHTSIQPTSQ